MAYLLTNHDDVKTDLSEPPRGKPRKAFSFVDRYVVLTRAKGRCEYCGVKLYPAAPKGASMALDHKQPLARGGADDVANLAASCADCNAAKQTKSAFEFLCDQMGFDIPAIARLDPALMTLSDEDEFFVDAAAFDFARRDAIADPYEITGEADLLELQYELVA